MANNFKNLKLVVFDFDGVFTDNRVYVDQEGRETVRCSRADGIGLDMLRKSGIEFLVLSAEPNSVVEKRCIKLNVRCITGCKEKLPVLQKLIQEKNIFPEDVGYVGNDLPDLECLNFVGFPVAVSGSHPRILKAAKYITRTKGGEGAVREICEYIYDSLNGENDG